MAEVLVVEDTILTRTILTNLLRENGYHVTEAVDGNDAVIKYFEIRPGLVLMDLLIPEKDGLTAIKEIIARNPNAKIIVCSADVQDVRISEAIEAGACEYITKPFDNEKVTDVTEKCLKSAAFEEMQHEVITTRAIMKDLIRNGIKRSIQASSKMTNNTVNVSVTDFSDLLDINFTFGVPEKVDQNTLMEKVSDIRFEHQVSYVYIVKGTWHYPKNQLFQ